MTRHALLLSIFATGMALAQGGGDAAVTHAAWGLQQALPDDGVVAGDAELVADPEGNGQCLRVGRGAEVTLPVADTDGHGAVRMEVYDSGFAREGADATAYGFGPLWGVANAGGARFVIGLVWAPFLNGNGDHSWICTAQNDWYSRWSAGLRRETGWHAFEFIIGADATVRVVRDGQQVSGIDPVGTEFGAGFSAVYLRGPTDLDEPVLVRNIEVDFTEGAPQRVLTPFPRTDWPLPDTHPVRPDPAWSHGFPQTDDFFPIAVWLQDPKNVAPFAEAGINIYVALWQGPTEEQLSALKEAGMSVICDQNQVGLAHIDDPIIVGWMHGDEPDNAQAIYDPNTGEMTGYGPPVPPEHIVAGYEAIHAADPSRPVMLNLGQGVANLNWRGRGSEGRPEDYDTYVLGADIVSFDVYPVADTELAASDRYLWLVPKGVDRLRTLTGNGKIIWNALECTRISNTRAKPTPHQVRTEAWMSIIHGSTGLIWFVHQFEPEFIEAGLLADEETLAEVSDINHRIHELASVLNSPTRADLATVETEPDTAPVDILVKRVGDETYIFAVGMQDAASEAVIRIVGLAPIATAEVLGEERSIAVEAGVLADLFGPHDVHIYRIR